MIQGGGFTPDMKQKETRGRSRTSGMASKGGLKNAVARSPWRAPPIEFGDRPVSSTRQGKAFLTTATVSPGIGYTVFGAWSRA